VISAVAVLLFIAAAAPVFALDTTPQSQDRRAAASIVDEVIRMSQAGVADQDIVAYLKKTRERFDVSADDIIAMTDAKVSKDVIHAVIDEADVRNGDRDRRVTRTVVEPAVYVGSPWFWDPFYYYDPFWYQPRLSLAFGFGHYFGGHSYGHGGGHNGGHSGGHHSRGHR
jgi:hypothetical protein